MCFITSAASLGTNARPGISGVKPTLELAALKRSALKTIQNIKRQGQPLPHNWMSPHMLGLWLTSRTEPFRIIHLPSNRYTLPSCNWHNIIKPLSHLKLTLKHILQQQPLFIYFHSDAYLQIWLCIKNWYRIFVGATGPNDQVKSSCNVQSNQLQEIANLAFYQLTYWWTKWSKLESFIYHCSNLVY